MVQLRIDVAVEREAGAVGFLYAEDVPKLIDRDVIAVEDETGRILGVKEAVASLAKRRPELLNARRGAGTPPRDNFRGPSRPPAPDPERPASLRSDMARTGNYSRM